MIVNESGFGEGMKNSRLTKKKISIFLVLIGGVCCGVAAGVFLALTHDLPQIRLLEEFSPFTVTRIYSADRVLLGELFVEKRDSVSLQKVPNQLIAALIATEDRSFYKHSGVDLKGILRAIIKNIYAGGRCKHDNPAAGQNTFSYTQENADTKNQGGDLGFSVGTPLHQG
ncbi:MAG: transglycosylase domain-containing protein [Deltaproteobacteria bacterium]|nr:transglycosylase domain-containing protein [Deltaproteobacteria bacterium]